jgi:RNA polymerase sigma factor (sigma-70 family)
MESIYIRRVIDGDVSAFTYFVNTYKGMAFTIAYRITGNREDGEEVAQDAFMKAYRSLKKFRQDSKFSTWFFRIVVNLALTRIKKNERWIDADVDVNSLPDQLVVHIESTYRELSAAEQKKIINTALDEMAREDSLLLTLFYLNENTIEEIGDITAIKVENIKMKLHRARKKMYTILNKMFQSTTKEIV